MAIFNNGDSTHQSPKTDTNTTIITAGSSIKGEMNLTCNLYVDGELEGKINSTKEVNIGKNGHINGDVTTQRLVVQGFVEGTLHADRVEIKANGHVKGTVEASELVIEAKGVFEGNSIVKGAKETPKPISIPSNNLSKEEIDQEIKKA